jgi:two-component system, chemotaxis family, CheB/CheR fusion protein
MTAEREQRSRRKRPILPDSAPVAAVAAVAADAAAGDGAAGPDAAPAASATPGATPFPVVGIGASAGGLAAFEAFFAAMPPEEGNDMAFVLVQHLSPDHKSLLADLVQRYTRMKVLEAQDSQPVQPGCAYIIPPNHDLSLVGGALYLTQHADDRRPHLTIDHFFSSLAAAQRERAIGVVMSGTGSDGTLGLREIKGEGGLVIVQAPESTEYDGMPRSAIATGMVDFVLPPAEIPAQLIAYVHHAFDPARKPEQAPLRDDLIKKMCTLLRAQTGHDFSQYKETTLVRRMERRMALRQMTHSDDYLRFARENPPEVEALFRDLLIGVTNFFRDPEAFRVLEHKVIPALVAHKAPHDALRVWVCGCSTGEEAYSIAILLYEHMMNTRQVLKVQVFATDIDRHAIEQARSGVYPDSIAANVSEERLSRFFTPDLQHGTYRIQKHIRDLLVFSEQDVIKDPPLSKLDLVSCRNLLIYLNAELQRKLIPLFHYALVPAGVLFLGTSETVGESARLFNVVDRKWKLYARQPLDKGGARPALPDFMPMAPEGVDRRPHPAGTGADADTGEGPVSLRQVTEKALVAHYGPAGVLIDDRGQILHIVGRTGKFLEPADGDAAMNILAMARDGLRRELTIAVRKAVAQKQVVAYPGLNVKANGDYIKANMAVRPVDMASGATVYLVVLEEVPPRPADAPPSPAQADQVGRIAELERELLAKDEYLQTTLEEMETTNEELKSTNEELETSKEELQSVNEELSTVNAELQDKVVDLSRANNDMNNLLAGTGVGTVFVDHQLRIARFTPAATQVINFIPADIGRPLEHVTSNLVGYDRMIDDISAVLETLDPKEAEVQVKSGAWYLMRIRPYRTMENLIEGAVITLVDISERKKAEESLRRSETRLNAFINQAYAGVSEADRDGRFLFANDRLCEMLGYSREELLRQRLSDLTDADDLPRVQAQFEALARGGPDIQVEKRYVRKNGSRVHVHERVSAIRDASGTPGSLLLLSFDPLEGGDGTEAAPSRN